jgi:hypothetical protein
MSGMRSTSRESLALRTAIVLLTLATGWIHLTLGGLLFTLNGLGYVAAGIALVVPLAFAARFRWLIRLGVIGYALSTIVGWALTGPRYDVAYLSKAIEVVLIMLLAVEVRAYDGNPINRIRRLLGTPAGA